MSPSSAPKRIAGVVLQSLNAGVTPRVGLQYIAVGREREMEALAHDLNMVRDGGAAFRLVSGRFGAGKSFLLQLLRTHAMEQGFVVMDCDLSAERRLIGSGGQGLATYRELVRRMATKLRPDGGALESVLDKWLSKIEKEVAAEGVAPGGQEFQDKVEQRVLDLAESMEELSHGFVFGRVLQAYLRGRRHEKDALRTAAVRWLRGEFSTKSEAREALGADVRVIIEEGEWYDHIKLLARFVKEVGHRGLLVFIDEGVNLAKISHRQAREANYEKLLTLLNDCLQGGASHLGVFIGATPDLIQDSRRGLFSYEALRSRLSTSRFVAQSGVRDLHGPVLEIPRLANEEIFLLLSHVRDLAAAQFGVQIADAQILQFLQAEVTRPGSSHILPREMVRDFLGLVSVARQTPDFDFARALGGVVSTAPVAPAGDPDEIPQGPDEDEAGDRQSSSSLTALSGGPEALQNAKDLTSQAQTPGSEGLTALSF